jgi:hypothetical protein
MKKMKTSSNHRVYAMSFASIYVLYIAKAEKKGRTKAEVNKVLSWVTGYSSKELSAHIKNKTTFEEFFAAATNLNPDRKLITGVVCGIRVEEVTESLMQEIRYLDKVIDELAKGWSIEKIMRVKKS